MPMVFLHQHLMLEEGLRQLRSVSEIYHEPGHKISLSVSNTKHVGTASYIISHPVNGKSRDFIIILMFSEILFNSVNA